MHLIRHGLKDRRKANTADHSQRVHPCQAFRHGSLFHSICKESPVLCRMNVQGQPGAEQATKRPWIAWAPAQHDTAEICVSGFQSHWKSWQSSPEFLMVPVTKANPGLKWWDEIISEKGNGLVRLFICGLPQRLPGQDPKIWQTIKIIMNNYNLGCWDTVNRLNLLSNVISPNRTGLVTRAPRSYTSLWLLSCDRLSAAQGCTPTDTC